MSRRGRETTPGGPEFHRWYSVLERSRYTRGAGAFSRRGHLRRESSMVTLLARVSYQ